MKHLHIFLPVLFFFLTGCALSPQIISIHPEIKTSPPPAFKDSGRLSLQVTDTRADHILGQRGGVYKETANIATEANITTPLQQKLEMLLIQSGYKVVNDKTIPVLQINISELSYAAYDGKLIKTIETRSEIKVQYTKGIKTYSNSYRTTRKKEMAMAPNDVENEKLINDTLAASLQQMLEDKELFTLINSN